MVWAECNRVLHDGCRLCIRERFLLSPLISVCIVFISISIVNYSLQCFIRNVFIVSDNCIYLIRNPKAQQLFPFDIQDVRKQYHLLLFSLPVSAFYSAIHRDIYIQSRSQLLLQQSASDSSRFDLLCE